MTAFSAEVDAWVLSSRKRLRAVFRESAQRVIADMQRPVAQGGNMRVDTGFLRASLVTTINNPASTITFNKNKEKFSYNGGDTSLVINGADIGDTVYAVYTASYARPREFKDGFVRLAAQKWKSTVSKVVLEARTR